MEPVCSVSSFDSRDGVALTLGLSFDSPSPYQEVYTLLTFSPSSQSSIILNEHSSFSLETDFQGMLLTSASGDLLFELKEPVLLAQGIAEGTNQIHCAFLKATGELCYSIIFTTGEHHTTVLGKLDIKTNRYDRLILLPVNKIIHIFYATSHLTLPDVWRITHLFWNGKAWKSAQLGEVVHPRSPLYHVLLDSKSNLHVLMMTFLGNRSVLLSSFFNGSFHIWSKRQEALSIPREVVDMAALITPYNTGYIFWAAKQPGSDKFEVGLASQPKTNDFMSTWQMESQPITNIGGPWKGIGAIHSEGILSLLIHSDQARLVQFNNRKWNFILSSPSQYSALQIIQKAESSINYTFWLNTGEKTTPIPLFANEIQLPYIFAYRNTSEEPTVLPNLPLVPDNESFPQLPSVETPSQSPSENPAVVLPQLSPENSNASLPQYQENPIIKDSSEEFEQGANPPVKNSSEKAVADEALITLMNGIKEITSSLTSALQSLGDKVDSIPDVLEELVRKNTETLENLRLLEDKVNELKTEREVAAKKGFWDRWFT
jgi:hypothetical protein